MERIKKIIKLGVLFLIRELWQLGCNIYGLFYNPFLVLRLTRKEKDWIQMVLLGVVILSPLLVFGVGWPTLVVGERILGMDFPRLNRLAMWGGGTIVLVQGGIVLYLLYWAWKVLIKNHKDSFLVK
jgi:hypothetical protein